nr:hypothetical protein [Mycobacterium riyadhense]
MAAYVLLDGADIPVLHLVADVDAHQVRMGMRVEAVWKLARSGDSASTTSSTSGPPENRTPTTTPTNTTCKGPTRTMSTRTFDRGLQQLAGSDLTHGDQACLIRGVHPSCLLGKFTHDFGSSTPATK